MIKFFRNAAVSVVFLILLQSTWGQPKIPPKYKDSPLEIVKLPKFCWAQYVDGAYTGVPGFSLPEVCGVYMNHFCPGLIHLSRASDISKPKAKRSESLRMATEDIQYTLQYTTPACPIYPDALAAKARADALRMFVK